MLPRKARRNHRRRTEERWSVTIFVDGRRRRIDIKRRVRLDGRVIRGR
jgi:hypothetical protein